LNILRYISGFVQKRLYASDNYNHEKIPLPKWPAWPDAGKDQEIRLRLHMSVLLPDSAQIVLATSGFSANTDPAYLIVVERYGGLRSSVVQSSSVKLCPSGLPTKTKKNTCTDQVKKNTVRIKKH
jgi:hypothetical protein